MTYAKNITYYRLFILKKKTTRNGCWNCPNQSIFSFMQLKLEKPKNGKCCEN